MTMPVGNAGNATERSLLPSIAAFVGLYAALALPVLWRQEVPLSWLLASVVLALPLAVLSAIDLREYRLPDVLTLPLAIAGVLVSWWFAPASLWWTIASMVIGFVLLAGVGMLYSHLRNREGLGLGDAKLFAASGAWLGLEGLPGVLLIACVAAIVALLVAAWRSKISATTRVPFGPFLAFGTWIVWLYGA
jgi:leader peptidase (prepilin peptidase) / N-methyltransferase